MYFQVSVVILNKLNYLINEAICYQQHITFYTAQLRACSKICCKSLTSSEYFIYEITMY